MKAVILAAGKGTRMRGLCDNTPKPLIPIGNRSIISVVFTRLRSMGVDEVALVIGHQGEQLQKAIGDGSRYGVSVTYVWQKEQLGTGHAALLCEDFVGRDAFVLIFGDIITSADNYPEMAKVFQAGKCDAVLTVFPVEDPSNGAAVDVKDGFVAGIVEKPPPGTMLNAYNNAGIFIWPAEIFDRIRSLKKSTRGEYEFTDGIIDFLNAGRRLAAFELRGYWENISDPEACIRMNQNVLAEALPPNDPKVHGGAKIGKGTRITGSNIAAGVTVATGCKLDGSTLGENCTLGPNVTADYAEVQAGAAIGEGCKLGAGVSIGEGAVIEANVRIGPNASIGPGCVVREGASVTSSILLGGATVGAGSSLVHVMLDANTQVESGEMITGTPEKTVEILRR